MGNFINKVILITGASSGIGRALAIQMAGKNVQLILAARNADTLNRVKEQCLLKGAECENYFVDLSVPASVTEFVNKVSSRYKTIDILVNNAGISQRSEAEETSIEIDRKIMEVNFFGQIALTKSLWPLLINSTHANIVLISSVVGSFGFPQRSAYAASKHALEGFFESWMIENKRRNVHFTVVSPGRINTNISYAALTADGTPHQKLDSGQANGISPEVCAKKIISGILQDKRKVYIAQQEMILIFLRNYFPYLFFRIAKKLNTV